MKTFLAFLAGASSVVLVTIVMGIVAQKNKEHEILHELDALESVEAVLLQAVVPDSIKQEAHDASHTIMYAEPDGNDYWSARSKMSIASEWAEENCSACRALQSMIEVRKERLTKLREGYLLVVTKVIKKSDGIPVRFFLSGKTRVALLLGFCKPQK